MALNTAQQIGAVLGVIVSAIAAFEGIRRAIVMPIVRAIRKLTQFFEDWFGEDARPGFARRPGVKEELATLREEQKHMAAEQTEMKQKLIRVEYHTGNGHEPALRQIVEAQGRELQKIKDQVTPTKPKTRGVSRD